MNDIAPILTALAAALFAAGVGVALSQNGRGRHEMAAWVLTGAGFALLIVGMVLAIAGHLAWVP